jgi:hypothetical protein
MTEDYQYRSSAEGTEWESAGDSKIIAIESRKGRHLLISRYQRSMPDRYSRNCIALHFSVTCELAN